MKRDEFLLEYAWLVKEFQNSNGMSFEELNERWMADTCFSEGNAMNYSTFHRHVESLVSLGIVIEYDRRGRVYRMINKTPRRGKELLEFLFQIVMVNKTLMDLMGLESRVSLQRFSMGEHVFSDVVASIKHNTIININYLPQKKNEITQHTVSPYGLKMFDNRTYLIGKSKRSILPFELDRIKKLEKTDQTFQMPEDFDIHDYYFHYYGVFRDENIPPEMVKVRAFKNENRYLKELPLHHSQRELAQTSTNYHDYCIFVSPTEDFIAKILSRQDRLLVLSPSWLVETIEEKLDVMQKMYKTMKKN